MSRLSKIDKKINRYPISARLVAAALFSGLIYLLIFTLPFLLPKFYATIPPVDYAKLSNHSPIWFWLYVFGVALLFGLYLWAIYLTAPTINGNKHPTSGVRRSLFLSSITFAIILIFSYPLTAIDLFIYAIRTRGWALYRLQPLATPPEMLPPADRWLGLAGEWVDAPSPYGPLWELFSLAGFYTSGGDFLPHLFALKIIAALAYLGCAWLVYKILHRIRPDWALAGTLAFAWNPLVLFESVQNAHNDIAMVFFLLAAIWVFVQIKPPPLMGGGWRGVEAKAPIYIVLFCLLLALSILVKFVTVIVAPFFLLVLAMQYSTWLRRGVAFAIYSVLIAIFVVVPMLPLWPGWGNWAVLKAGSGAGRSLLALLILSLRNFLGTNTAFDLSRNLILVIYVLIYLYFLWKTFSQLHRTTPSQITPPISAAFYSLFWYVLLAAPVFHAWYLLWVVPLAALLLPRQRPLSAAIVFSITALLVIPYFETVRVWYPTLIQNHLLGHLIGVPLLIVPPILSLIWPIRLGHTSEV